MHAKITLSEAEILKAVTTHVQSHGYVAKGSKLIVKVEPADRPGDSTLYVVSIEVNVEPSRGQRQ